MYSIACVIQSWWHNFGPLKARHTQQPNAHHGSIVPLSITQPWHRAVHVRRNCFPPLNHSKAFCNAETLTLERRGLKWRLLPSLSVGRRCRYSGALFPSGHLPWPGEPQHLNTYSNCCARVRPPKMGLPSASCAARHLHVSDTQRQGARGRWTPTSCDQRAPSCVELQNVSTLEHSLPAQVMSMGRSVW